MKVDSTYFGTLVNGLRVDKHTLENRKGLTVGLSAFGAAIIQLAMPDRSGRIDNIVLGYDALEDYERDRYYLGGTIGRYANRIAKGRFFLDGRRCDLARNDGAHHLHGGVEGFNQKLWSAEAAVGSDTCSVTFSYLSEDGEENYPGNLNVTVTYRLTDSNELFIDYTARTDRMTPVNLTNHAYWNLLGAGKSTILDHELTLNCSRYLEVDETLIPTGEVIAAENAALDFTRPKRIGTDIAATGNGYDHCFVVDEGAVPNPGGLSLAATVRENTHGRCMTVYTDQPGIQLYTGNFLDGVRGCRGAFYGKHAALCLETQNFPDAVNQPGFPDPILLPGDVFRTTTMHGFTHC